MKTILKVFVVLIVVTGLDILAAMGWGAYWLYRHSAQLSDRTSPSEHGRNMEIHLLARLGPATRTVANQASETQNRAEGSPVSAIPDTDVFRQQDVSSYIATGEAPAGWKWIPVARGAEQQMGVGAQSRFVTRTSDGQMFLLAADTHEMALTHASDVKPWGVLAASTTFNGTSPAVSILLDNAGGDLMYDFTRKHVGHIIAVVIGGQIYEIAEIRSPIRDAMMISLAGSRQAEAEKLRDTLMK